MADSESVRYPAIPNWAKTTPPGPAEDKYPYSLVMFDEEGNGSAMTLLN